MGCKMKNITKTYTFTISSHYLTALIYNDFSGLEVDDLRHLSNWEAENNVQHVICPENTETTFARCDICKLHSDVLEVEVICKV